MLSTIKSPYVSSWICNTGLSIIHYRGFLCAQRRVLNWCVLGWKIELLLIYCIILIASKSFDITKVLFKISINKTSLHISELMNTCGVEFPREELWDKISPTSEFDDVLLVAEWEEFVFVFDWFEFLLVYSYEVLRDDSCIIIMACSQTYHELFCNNACKPNGE